MTLDEAKNECKTSKSCKGVFDMDCSSLQKYYLCSGVLETEYSIEPIESCVHKKFIVGEDLTRFYRRIDVKKI